MTVVVVGASHVVVGAAHVHIHSLLTAHTLIVGLTITSLLIRLSLHSLVPNGLTIFLLILDPLILVDLIINPRQHDSPLIPDPNLFRPVQDPL